VEVEEEVGEDEKRKGGKGVGGGERSRKSNERSPSTEPDAQIIKRQYHTH